MQRRINMDDIYRSEVRERFLRAERSMEFNMEMAASK
jgi:hypothetical protein